MNQLPVNIVCICPVYNDWESFAILHRNIVQSFEAAGSQYRVRIVAVDDGSSEGAEQVPPHSQVSVEMLTLKNNVGHQRAIAIGLQYVSAAYKDFGFVVVLDSDGEDKPQDILALVKSCAAEGSRKIVFARRKRRQESFFFKLGYFTYKAIFYMLTGQRISFGNFSCIPAGLLGRVVVLENIWNHYSGSIVQSRIPFGTIMLDRGKRYRGKSKMNSTSLILHGLSSISVYFDFLSVRILKLSMVGVVACLISVMVVLYYKLFTNLAIPGWASNLILIFFTIILQLSSVTLIVLLMQLSARKNIKKPDSEIYRDFLAKTNQL